MHRLLFTFLIVVLALTCFDGVDGDEKRERPAGEAFDPAKFFPDDSRLWSRAGRAIVLSDLSRVEPAAALNTGRRRTKGQWKVIPYKTSDFSGQALSVFPSTGASAVSLPLTVSGWHAVYVGIGSTSNGISAIDNNVRVRLSGDAVYTRMSNHQKVNPKNDRRHSIQEVFLTVAETNGQSVEFAPVPFVPANVMYVKLVPLTAAEVKEWQAREPDPAARPLIATFDGHSWIWPYRPRTAADLKETFEGFQNTDFTKWWFQPMGADLVCYPSEVGTVPGWNTEDFPRWEYKEYVESLKALFEAGVNPLKVAREAAREQGAEFHVMIRPGAWKGALSLEEVFDSRFYEQHPEWRCVDRDGNPTIYMSYAVPEVRAHVIAVIREALDVDPRGVGFLFHRGLPLLLWEDAFCERFKQRYGEDARNVPEDDPRIQAMRAEIMTDLLSETRAVLDEEQARRGRKQPYTISVATFNKESDNDRHGLAVEQWIDQGLVDDVAVAWFAYHTSFSEDGLIEPDMEYYRRITKGHDVGLYPFVIAWKPGTPARLSRTVSEYYDNGATGIAVWDPKVHGGWRNGHEANLFDTLSRLGHEDYVRRWAEAGMPKPLVIPLTQFGDNHFSPWFPNTGF